ncbi:amidohydrolase family protein [Microbispora sp. H10836]|uniref:amidohydrolase family protein n=1 Tax=Microbispora sp. H10836 TaxID=2729106 RepID=UPI001473C19D|nr:amidohydrolase family protein [Microbispora sp. H10836]
MKIDDLIAIDVHTHVLASTHNPTRGGESDKLSGTFGNIPELTVPELAAYYRERRMAAVVFTVDSPARTGRGPTVSNEEIAGLAADASDVLIPFASIDPHRGAEGVAAARRLIEDFGVRGFKFHPSDQGFYPNDRLAYPLYEVIAEAGIPALFHSGQTGVGAGQRGGGGIRLKYSNPLHLDDVAVDFPDMPIIIAHPSFPWQDEALAVAGHKPQVYIDLSGWSPKYFPDSLVAQVNSLLKHKVLFGSDFPAITPDRWLGDFAKLPIKDEVRPLVLRDNAARLFGMEKK